MNSSAKELNRYCESYTSAEPDYLHRLERQTHLKTLSPQMISGYYQGRILSMISKIIRPKRILEIGTFTGYSALCLAEGLVSNGQLLTIEVNPEMKHIIDKAILESPYADQIQVIYGNAKQVISQLNEEFDLIFMDAAKQDYLNYYELLFDCWAPGGILLADNVLWGGKVSKSNHDADTASLHQFNLGILEDNRVENIILPIRDGINMIRKK